MVLEQLKEELATDRQVARFIFEAEITGNLEHPGVVPVYGRGVQPDGRPYYAMRFVRGDNLKVAVDRFHKNAALKTDAGARQREFQKLLRRYLVVCETMAYVHSRGVLHRDLKPRNILLGPYGETLIVDWGLAKVVGHAEQAEASDATIRPPSSSDLQPTVAGSRVGTPAYMSPEQCARRNRSSWTGNGHLQPGCDPLLRGHGQVAVHGGGYSRCPSQGRTRRISFSTPSKCRCGPVLDAICRKAMALNVQDRYPTWLCPRRRPRTLAGRSTRLGISRATPPARDPLGSPAKEASRHRGGPARVRVRRPHPARLEHQCGEGPNR